MLGLFLLYKIRSAGTHLNVITLKNMQGRGPRENIQKSIHLRVFKGLYFVFCFSAFIEKRVTLFLYLVYNSWTGIVINL